MKQQVTFPDADAGTRSAGSSRVQRVLRIGWLVMAGVGILFLGLTPFVLGCLTQMCFRRALPELAVLLMGTTCFLALWQFTEWQYIYHAGEDSFLLSYVFFAIFFSGGTEWVRGWLSRRPAA